MELVLLRRPTFNLRDLTPSTVTSEPSTSVATTSSIFRVNTTPYSLTPPGLFPSRITSSGTPRPPPRRTTQSRITSSRTPSSRTTPSRTTIVWTTRRIIPPYERRHPKLHGQGTDVEEHHYRHHHTPIHRIHPHIVPDPTTDSSRIEVHRPLSPVTNRPETKPTVETLTHHTPTRIVRPHRPLYTKPVTTISPEEKDDVTIVTALIDIGRGDWDRYRRPLEQYHIFMENLLSLQNNMVIFTDTSSYDFIHKYRKNMGEMHRTKIHLITLNDLPLYRHLDAASKIIKEERQNDRLWRSIWDPAMRDHPEARSAEYNVLVNSKSYFLYNVSLEDPFSTEFFVWIDAGYGHGNQSVFPFNNRWKPRFPRNKISLIKLTPVHDLISGYTIDSLYRRNWSVVSGGFVAGDKRSVGQLHTLVHRKFIELTYRNKVDDDQTTLVLVINQYPQLFSITHGGWFDAFRLFGPDEYQAPA
ncbi:hypothetical protein NECAME_08027 [Necator americanus]|uniref:Protein HtrL n=1 Tax=Necator americanus TaxID=51031 RepID=W2TN06_NECAM|nr:hypothetical protein NECAME_08027 [Necator americanus]ETN82377.1 hypothetical protein NECAME_08027 [Necator americanus]